MVAAIWFRRMQVGSGDCEQGPIHYTHASLTLIPAQAAHHRLAPAEGHTDKTSFEASRTCPDYDTRKTALQSFMELVWCTWGAISATYNVILRWIQRPVAGQDITRHAPLVRGKSNATCSQSCWAVYTEPIAYHPSAAHKQHNIPALKHKA
jgi:hypothetical protein